MPFWLTSRMLFDPREVANPKDVVGIANSDDRRTSLIANVSFRSARLLKEDGTHKVWVEVLDSWDDNSDDQFNKSREQVFAKTTTEFKQETECLVQ